MGYKLGSEGLYLCEIGELVYLDNSSLILILILECYQGINLCKITNDPIYTSVAAV